MYAFQWTLLARANLPLNIIVSIAEHWGAGTRKERSSNRRTGFGQKNQPGQTAASPMNQPNGRSIVQMVVNYAFMCLWGSCSNQVIL